MKSYWRVYDPENGETISVMEKEIKSDRDLDYILDIKKLYRCVEITQAEYFYHYPNHGVDPVGAIPKPNNQNQI